MFKQAIKTESKLRMAIAGPSGSGKTYTALAVAMALVPGGKVAVIDTEHGSAAKYADLFTFDTATAAPPYHPDGLIKLVNFAVNAGYDVVVVDSISHYWSGAGGVLDIKEEAERRMRNPNSYTAWKDVTPIHQRMVDTLVGIDAHVIVTMRSKQDYILVEKNGKQVPQKVGMAPVQRDGFEYEFDVMLDMDIENVGRVQKTRCPALTGAAFSKPGGDLAGTLREWLTGAPNEAPPPIVYNPAASKTTPAPLPAHPPVDALLYGDGSFVADDARAHAIYHAYVEAHNGKAPDNRFNLQAWHKKQQNGNAPAAQPANKAKPADYYEGMKELNVITGEPEKLFDVPPTGPGAFSEE